MLFVFGCSKGLYLLSNFIQYQNMGIVSIPKLLKTLKCVLIGTLFVSSGWFMGDVYEKYQSKATSFRVHSEERIQVPTTMLCFTPYAKPRGNFTKSDLISVHMLQKYQ